MRGGTLTHNHPDGSSLSLGDLQFASISNLREIRAFDARQDGTMYVYSMKAPDGWPSSEKLNSLRSEFQVERTKLVDDWTSKVDAGTMKRADAALNLNHELWTRLAAKYGVVYKRTTRTK